MTLSYTRKVRLAERIVSARKSAGLTQERLAERVGTSRRHVIRWENAEHRPGREYVKRIAAATGQTVEFFAADDEDEEDDMYEPLAHIVRDLVRYEVRRAGEEVHA